MRSILIRYAELGLKSERVRARFTRHLIDNITDVLSKLCVDHIIFSTRGRIFIESDQIDNTLDILRTIPGIYSMSVVEEAPSDMDCLMDEMAEYARTRLKEGMSFGIKVRRIGETGYTSRDIAIAGGDAVCRHLDDSKVTVDLKDPDIWFEVEIRGKKAYLFTDRIKGMGGMPYDTQGKVILYFPSRNGSPADDEMELRARLSYIMMRRRGCKVIPVVLKDDATDWNDTISELTRGEGRPFILDEGEIKDVLISAIRKTGASGMVHPAPAKDVGEEVPVLHKDGTPVSVFQPTAGLSLSEIKQWIGRFH